MARGPADIYELLVRLEEEEVDEGEEDPVKRDLDEQERRDREERERKEREWIERRGPAGLSPV